MSSSSQLLPVGSAGVGAAQRDPAEHPFLLKIRELLCQVAGILQPDHHLQFLQDRCQKRMQELMLPTLNSYYDLLVRDREQLNQLLNIITIGETCFFRNGPQLNALRTEVLPSVLEDKSHVARQHLRIWSAGCSTGEEAYTLAILLLEERQTTLQNVPFMVLATDINSSSLASANSGLYSDYSMRHLDPKLRQKYFLPQGDQWAVKPEVKSVVQFSQLNLVDDLRMTSMNGMAVIFCCNVMIYLDASVRKGIVQHFYNGLLPKGYLFMGHAESLYGINADFRLVHFPGATGYCKVDRRG